MKLVVYMAFIVIAALGLLLLRLSPEFAIGAAVMPGPLTDAHAEYESKCSECHSPFNDQIQNDLCAGCHEQVREDMNIGRGYHGRSPAVVGKPCKLCHTEHVGRDASIVSLDERTFDHKFTDFPLLGAHASASTACSACHKNGRKHRETPNDCFGCHSDRDDHDGQLGKDCASCHKESYWDDTAFGHEMTCFPLEGKHREAACDACHHDKAYTSASSNCNACHLMSDIHDSGPDERCDRCHGADSWREFAFEHGLETGFALEDRHAEIDCQACHAGLKFGKKPGAKCVDCHQPSDIHKGKVGLSCDDCHTSSKWDEPTFDHNSDTEFELSGGHVEVKCIECHKQDIEKEKPASDCNGCHKTQDVHKQQLGTECDNCHNTDGWTERIAFDHDITRFPLIGLHAVTACGECHPSSAYKGTDTACKSCHENDDYHKKTLGAECGSCHNPNGWSHAPAPTCPIPTRPIWPP